MLNKNRLSLGVPIAIVLALSGCKIDDSLGQLTSVLTPAQVEDSFTIVQPSGAEIDDTLAAPHLTAVLRATAMRLRGGTDEDAAVRYGVHNIGGKPVSGVALEGLSLKRVSMIGDRPLAEAPPGHRVEGVLHFSDDVGRSLSFGLAVDYRTFSGAIEVEKFSLAPIFLAHPVVEMFVVPGDTLKNVSGKIAGDYPAFYRKVRDLAVDMRDSSAGGGGVKEYAFVVFVKDLSPKGSSLQFKFASEPKSRDGDMDTNVFHYVYDGGWALGAITREIDLRAGPERWVKVIYKPGPDAKGPEDRVRTIGLFSTRPGGTRQSMKLGKGRIQG